MRTSPSGGRTDPERHAQAPVTFTAKGTVTFTPSSFHYGPICNVWTTPAGVAASTTVV